MPYRTSILVNHASGRQRYAGWSNTFWNGTSDLATLYNQTQALAHAINECMGNHSVPVAARHSLLSPGANAIIAGKRQVALQRFNFTLPGVGTGSASATPEKCLVMRDHSGLYSRQWFMNGIPDLRESDGGDFVPSGDYQARLQALINVLTDGGNSWRLHNQDRNAATIDILTCTVAGLVTTDGNHGFANADTVTITGARYPNTVPKRDRINGVWRIINTSPTTFTLRLNQDQSINPAWLGQAKAQKQTQMLQNYISPGGALPAVQVVRAGSHPVGRPFDVHTGRRIP